MQGVLVTSNADVEQRLTAWLKAQVFDADDLGVEGLDRVEFGHSAEMLLLTVVWQQRGRGHRQDVVVRLRPPSPGLLEPYELQRQFDVLRGLESTRVCAPRALWIEDSGDILGRPFFVMERLPGRVYERVIPEDLRAAPDRISRMADSVVEQLAQIHLTDLHATGLDALGGGDDYLDQELFHWGGEMQRWQRGRLPALERLLEALRRQRPEQTPRVTLVHGDPKGGNFAFVDDEVSAVFDWEMATLGDPLADIGWMDLTWRLTLPFSTFAPVRLDELLARYEELVGITLHDREWYRALATFKMSVIMLVATMLFDRGHSNDPRFAQMSDGVPALTALALHDLGIDQQLDPGPLTARAERLDALRTTG